MFKNSPRPKPPRSDTFRIWNLIAAAFLVVGNHAHAQTSINPLLSPLLERYKLPALAAAVAIDGKIVAAGAVGTRRIGTDAPVSVNDRFHLGSDTKAMTALLAGMLVDEGKIQWNSTVGDLFPELASSIDAGLKLVTLEQLLSHTSGIPSDNDEFDQLVNKTMLQAGNLDEMRYWLVKQWAPKPLAAKPGSKFAYANMNYILAGVILERKTGKTWEEQIIQRVFGPLELKSAGLGPQSSLGKIDAPLGHAVIDGKTKAFLAGPNGDNPPILGPAGTAHMSINDFARWASWNAGQGKRGPALVKTETLKKLHAPVISLPEIKKAAPGTPSLGKYCMGWGEVTADWADGPLIYHGGSNQINLAHIWLEPKHDFAMVLATNIGGKGADEALKSLAPELYRKFSPAKTTEKKGP